MYWQHGFFSWPTISEGTDYVSFITSINFPFLIMVLLFILFAFVQNKLF